MKKKGVRFLAVVLFGLGWTVASDAADAGGSTAARYAEMREACGEQGGKFEQSWLYNDQGVRWGEVLSCSTRIGYVSCQDDVCRSGRWGRSGGTATAYSGQSDDGDVMQFPAEPVAFANAVAALAVK